MTQLVGDIARPRTIQLHVSQYSVVRGAERHCLLVNLSLSENFLVVEKCIIGRFILNCFINRSTAFDCILRCNFYVNRTQTYSDYFSARGLQYKKVLDTFEY